MRHTQEVVIEAVARNTSSLRQAACTGYVRLYDVDAPSLRKVHESLERRLLLARGDAHIHGIGKLGIAVQIIRRQRLLQPEEIEFLEATGHFDRLRGIPDQSDIDHEILVARG